MNKAAFLRQRKEREHNSRVVLASALNLTLPCYALAQLCTAADVFTLVTTSVRCNAPVVNDRESQRYHAYFVVKIV